VGGRDIAARDDASSGSGGNDDACDDEADSYWDDASYDYHDHRGGDVSASWNSGKRNDSQRSDVHDGNDRTNGKNAEYDVDNTRHDGGAIAEFAEHEFITADQFSNSVEHA
jgi:hypothetical protein